MYQVVTLYIFFDNIIYQNRVGLFGEELEIWGNNGFVSICSFYVIMDFCFFQRIMDLKLWFEWIFLVRLIIYEYIYLYVLEKIIFSFQYLQFWEGRGKLCESIFSGGVY